MSHSDPTNATALTCSGKNNETETLSRRTFVRNVGVSACASYAAIASLPANARQQRPPDANPLRDHAGEAQSRSREAFDRRVTAAQQQRALPEPNWPTNADETDLAQYVGNFSKTLPHTAVGEVDPAAYEQLLNALDSGNASDFDAIAAGGQGKLANPRAAYAFALAGADSHKIDLPAVHAFSSARQAAEAAEVYWVALCRDVPFDQYASHPLTQAAAADLSNFSDFTAPRGTTAITPAELFRGQSTGDLQGPYLSAFFLCSVA